MARSRWGKPPPLRGTLGTLLRTTWQQVGQVREAASRQAHSGRVRLDEALLARRRKEALAALGEEIYELAARGELGDVEGAPGVRERLSELEDLDEALSRAEERARRAGGRRAFAAADEQPPAAAGRGEPMRVWRPVHPGDTEAAEPAEPRPTRRRPRRPARAARGPGGITFVDEAPPDGDEDLSEYMHADDVPARVPTGEPDGGDS